MLGGWGELAWITVCQDMRYRCTLTARSLVEDGTCKWPDDMCKYQVRHGRTCQLIKYVHGKAPTCIGYLVHAHTKVQNRNVGKRSLNYLGTLGNPWEGNDTCTPRLKHWVCVHTSGSVSSLPIFFQELKFLTSPPSLPTQLLSSYSIKLLQIYHQSTLASIS